MNTNDDVQQTTKQDIHSKATAGRVLRSARHGGIAALLTSLLALTACSDTADPESSDELSVSDGERGAGESMADAMPGEAFLTTVGSGTSVAGSGGAGGGGTGTTTTGTGTTTTGTSTGTSTGAGTGGAGGAGDPIPTFTAAEIDDCPGMTAALDIGQTFHIHGDTTELTDQLSSTYCMGAAAKDGVFSIDVATAGALEVTVQGNDPGMDVRFIFRPGTACAEFGESEGCFDASTSAVEQFRTLVDVGTYTLIVENAGTDGDLEVTVGLAASACGDGLEANDEGCDDGNQTPGDGCDEFCEYETSGSDDTCAGATQLLVNEGEAFTPFYGTTVGYATDYAPPASCTDDSGPERVFEIVPNLVEIGGTGTLTVSVGKDALGNDGCALDPWADTCIEWVLMSGTPCGSISSEGVSCIDENYAFMGGATETLEIPVNDGSPVYVYVKGYAPWDQGAFYLNLSVVGSAP